MENVKVLFVVGDEEFSEIPQPENTLVLGGIPRVDENVVYEDLKTKSWVARRVTQVNYVCNRDQQPLILIRLSDLTVHEEERKVSKFFFQKPTRGN